MIQENVIDIPILPLDQNSPNTEGPVGRLKSLVNADVTSYSKTDGTVKYSVGKRLGFTTMSQTVKNPDATSAPNIVADQVLYGDVNGLTALGSNRIYNKATNWISAIGPNGGGRVCCPQTLRQDVLYSADSQVTAPDQATITNTTCLVWSEVSQKRTDDDIPTLPWNINNPTALNGCRIAFRNEVTKTYIRPPLSMVHEGPIGGGELYSYARVVAQGTFFYVFAKISNGPTAAMRLFVYDTNGVQVANTSLGTATTQDAGAWDAHAFPAFGGAIIAICNGTGVDFTKFLWNGSSLTSSSNTDNSVLARSKQCAWVENDFIGATGFLVTVDNDGVNTHTHTVRAWRITSGLAQNHAYAIIASPIGSETASLMKWISGITGFVSGDSGSPDITVAVTVMDFTGLAEHTTYYGAGAAASGLNSSGSDRYPDQNNTFTLVVFCGFSDGASTLNATNKSQQIVSRAFHLKTEWFCVTYYPARKWGPLVNNDPIFVPFPAQFSNHQPFRVTDGRNSQPCWLVMPIGTTQTLNLDQSIAGRFEYGIASADWQTVFPLDLNNSNTTYGTFVTNRVICSPTLPSSGAIAIPLAYRVEQSAQVGTLIPVNASNSGETQESINDAVIGLKEFYIGPDVGRPFTANGVTWLPGLMAATYEAGEYAEQGCLAPEAPWITEDVVHSFAANSANFGQHQYRVVSEVTSKTGKLYRSLPSSAFSYVYNSSISNGCGTVNLHAVNPTLHNNLRLSIYRSAVIEQVPTPLFTKITSDLQPFYNDTTAGVVTFKDSVNPLLEGSGEPLYTNTGELPHFPAPAFRSGCVWLNRVWLIGYDNALWFSAEIREDEQPWFNVAFRIPVAGDEITAVAPMDDILLVFCKNSIKRVDAVQLPDRTGSPDNIPAPLDLPFESGCSGFVKVIRDGVAYSSSGNTRGVWLITRQLTNVWLSEGARNDLSGSITGMEVDGLNRLFVSTGVYLMVYDTVTRTWRRWNTPTNANIIGVSISRTDVGTICYADQGGVVWQLDSTNNFDRDNTSGSNSDTHVQMLVEFNPLHFGNVRGWKRTWAIQVQGEKKSNCYFQSLLYYDDTKDAPVTFYQRAVTESDTELQVEINPFIETSASLVLIIFDAVTSTGLPSYTPGAGFTLDILAAQVGLEKGLTKVNPSKRVRKQ